MLQALRIDGAGAPNLSESGWRQALDFADLAQLTLVLRAQLERRGWEGVPASIRQRLDRNLADNTERGRRLLAASAEIEERLEKAGIAFVILKGQTHSPDFIPDPRLRTQYDFDYCCRPDTVGRARDVLLELGYEPAERFDDVPTDHLPTLIRKTGWSWRGNYFDPEIPPAVDLHFRLWDAATERIAAPGIEQFWARREGHALGLVDRLGYAALHALRHLLRGSLRIFHVYEIARFLEARKDDTAFWARWRDLHPPELRRLESILFQLAARYFGAPELSDVALPPDVALWIERYAWSPVDALFRPNKHELYLHMALLDSWPDRWAVARRRLVPATLPGPVEGVYTPADQLTVALRIRKSARYAAFLAGRLWRHGRLLIPTLWGLLAWKRRRAPALVP